MESNLDIIIRELARYGGRQKPAGTHRMVQCAFHDDNGPSMGINLSQDNGIPLGWVNCFGCEEAKGPWNKFAEKAGLEKIVGWNNKENETGELINRQVEDALLGETGSTMKGLLNLMGCREAQPWPVSLEWRGFDGGFLNRLGGQIINDNYNDSVALLLPVSVNGKIRGGVKAKYERKSKEDLAYVTTNGAWAQKYALFPYDNVVRAIKKKRWKFVVLVEGPRDALRLLSEGIPALAILGAQVFSGTKAMLVANLGIDCAYVMSDNDTGGDLMWRNVRKNLKPLVTTRRLKLPVKFNRRGELIKIDPNSMSDQMMARVKKLLRDRHGL